jgi:hypothetical protein
LTLQEILSIFRLYQFIGMRECNKEFWE